jgi:hypothetical protein
MSKFLSSRYGPACLKYITKSNLFMHMHQLLVVYMHAFSSNEVRFDYKSVRFDLVFSTFMFLGQFDPFWLMHAHH